VRTLGLMRELADEDSASYLSGLLIGHEVHDALEAGRHVHVIGAPALTALYGAAIAQCGGTFEDLSSDAAAAGLARIGAEISWK
jgi:2-dehydro-3-deoxygalactonokinase